MSESTQTSLSDKYILIYSCSSAGYLANEIVDSCFDDLSICVLTRQCSDNIEKKLRALILAIEHSFGVYDKCAEDGHTIVNYRNRATGSTLIDHLHNECSTIKFGINPMPVVSDLYKLWSIMLFKNRGQSLPYTDIVINFID